MDGAEGLYLFRHALLRDAAYQLLVPSDRARLHEAALELLESAGAEPIELADHAHCAREARGSASTERLARAERQHLLAAARKAEREYRIGDAEQLVSRLATVTGDQPACRLEVARLRTRLSFMQGHGPEAVAAANDLLVMAEATADPDLLAKARLEAGRTMIDLADTTRARELLTLAAARMRQSQSAELATCLGSLSTAVWFSVSAEQALPVSDEAIAAARAAGDVDSVCGISINRVNMLSGLRRVQEAAALLEQIRPLLPRVGPGRAVMFEMTAGILAFYDMRREEAARHYSRALDMARAIGMQAEVARALTNLASLDLPGVTPRLALERQAEASRIAGECGDLRLALFALQGEAEALARIRDYEAAAQRLQTAHWYAQTLGLPTQAHIVRLSRAAMLLAIPGQADAMQECLHALEEAGTGIETDLAWIATASVLAEHFLRLGDTAQARAWAGRAFNRAASNPGILQDAQTHLRRLDVLREPGFTTPNRGG